MYTSLTPLSVSVDCTHHTVFLYFMFVARMLIPLIIDIELYFFGMISRPDRGCSSSLRNKMKIKENKMIGWRRKKRPDLSEPVIPCFDGLLP